MARLPVDKRVRRYRPKFKHNGVNNLSSLPAEILVEIGRYLNLPDIEALSATDRYLHEVFADTLQKDQAFARGTIRDLTLTSDEYGYHDFLLQVLKREVNPNYVKRFDCQRACIHRHEPFRQDEEEIDIARYIGWTSEDVDLIRKAISRSPWLKGIVLPDELMTEMLQGSEEAVLMLLIPMLKNLSIFLPPDHYGRAPLKLPKLFLSIARAQIMAEDKNSKALERLPLRRLHTIYSDICLTGAEIVQYMCLPSVKRGIFSLDENNITGDLVADAGFPSFQKDLRSLQGVPRSRASTIYMSGDTFRDLAELLFEFIAGPCTIRLYQESLIPDESETSTFSIREHAITVAGMLGLTILPSDPMWYFWDHCVISRDRKVDASDRGTNTPTSAGDSECRTVNFSLKYRYPQERARDIKEYEDALGQLGVVPSPQWLALARWDRGLIHPNRLDDDNFMLEE